jgi:hypothetical protein
MIGSWTQKHLDFLTEVSNSSICDDFLFQIMMVIDLPYDFNWICDDFSF